MRLYLSPAAAAALGIVLINTPTATTFSVSRGTLFGTTAPNTNYHTHSHHVHHPNNFQRPSSTMYATIEESSTSPKDGKSSTFFTSSTTSSSTVKTTSGQSSSDSSGGAGNYLSSLKSTLSSLPIIGGLSGSGMSSSSYLDKVNHDPPLQFTKSSSSSSSTQMDMSSIENQVEQEINLHKDSFERKAVDDIGLGVNKASVEENAVDLAEGSKSLGEVLKHSSSSSTVATTTSSYTSSSTVSSTYSSPLNPQTPQQQPNKDYSQIELELEQQVNQAVEASVESAVEGNVIDLVMQDRQEEMIVENQVTFPPLSSSSGDVDTVHSRLFTSSETQDQSAKDKIEEVVNQVAEAMVMYEKEAEVESKIESEYMTTSSRSTHFSSVSSVESKSVPPRTVTPPSSGTSFFASTFGGNPNPSPPAATSTTSTSSSNGSYLDSSYQPQPPSSYSSNTVSSSSSTYSQPPPSIHSTPFPPPQQQQQQQPPQLQDNVQTTTTSLYNLSQTQLSNYEQKVESKSSYRTEEMIVEAEVVRNVEKDVEQMAENLVSAAVEQGKNFFSSISQFAKGSKNNFFESSTSAVVDAEKYVRPGANAVTPPPPQAAGEAATQSYQAIPSQSIQPQAPSQPEFQPEPHPQVNQLKTTQDIGSLENKAENDFASLRAKEIAAEAKVMKEVEFSAERLVEMSAVELAEGRKSVDDFADSRGSSSQLFVSSDCLTTFATPAEENVDVKAEIPRVVKPQPVQNYVPPVTNTATSEVVLPSSNIEPVNVPPQPQQESKPFDMRSIEREAEAKVMAEIERTAERMVEEGAAALAEGRDFEFDTSSSFVGSTTSKYFYKQSTTFDEPVITTIVPGTPVPPPPAAIEPQAQEQSTSVPQMTSSTTTSSPTTTSTDPAVAPKLQIPPPDYKTQELKAEREAMGIVESDAENMVEGDANALAEGKKVTDSIASFSGSTSKFFTKPTVSEEVSVVTTVTPPHVANEDVSSASTPTTSQPKPEYKPFTPLPNVQTKEGGYLDALAHSSDSKVNTYQGTGQKGYLDALQSESTQSNSGAGMTSYLDNVGSSKPLSSIKSSAASVASPIQQVTPQVQSSVPVAPPVEYKEFTPLPSVDSSEGNYLNALASSGTSKIPGTGSAQKGYLDALQADNVPRSSGTGMSGYLDNVSSSDPIAFTTVPPHAMQNVQSIPQNPPNQYVPSSNVPKTSVPDISASTHATPSGELNVLPMQAGSQINDAPVQEQEDCEETITFEGNYLAGITTTSVCKLLAGIPTTSVCKLGISSTRSSSRTYVQNSLMASRSSSEPEVRRDTSMNLFKSIRNGMRRTSRLFMSSSDFNEPDKGEVGMGSKSQGSGYIDKMTNDLTSENKDDTISLEGVEFQSEKVSFPSGSNVQKVRTATAMSLEPEMINVAETYASIEQRQRKAEQQAIERRRKFEEERRLKQQIATQNVEQNARESQGFQLAEGKSDTTLQLELIL